MKTYLLSILITLSLFASAQLTAPTGPFAIPRTGNKSTPYRPNTYASLSQRFYSVPADAVGQDSVTLSPIAYYTIVAIDTLLDSLTVTQVSVANQYEGDVLKFEVKNTSTGKSIYFQSNYFLCTHNTGYNGTSAKLCLTASKNACITFVFHDGFWVEESRVLSAY